MSRDESFRRVAKGIGYVPQGRMIFPTLSVEENLQTGLELVTAAQALREAEIQLALRDFELVRARVLAVLVLASCPW